MKIVYRATNITESDIVAGMLRSRGIEATVVGRHLQIAMGSATLFYPSTVLIMRKQEYDDALAVVAEYETLQPASEQKTKPMFFRVSVFMLLIWLFTSGPPTLGQLLVNSYIPPINWNEEN